MIKVSDMKTDFKTQIDADAAENMAKGMHIVMNGLLPGWQDDPSTADTANRFIKYLAEFRQPLDTEKVFGTNFEVADDHPSMVIQTPIPFRGVCEHHLLPMTGVAALGYIPHERVIGLSKLTRLVDAVGVEGPSLQEAVAHRIVNLMVEHLKPKGVMLVIKSAHGCMSCRGVKAPGVDTISSVVQGVFRDNVAARQEFMMLTQGNL